MVPATKTPTVLRNKKETREPAAPERLALLKSVSQETFVRPKMQSSWLLYDQTETEKEQPTVGSVSGAPPEKIARHLATLTPVSNYKGKLFGLAKIVFVFKFNFNVYQGQL
jgi:hypothetical protein